MKRKITYLFLLGSVAIIAMSFGVLSSNGRAGYTNSPNETNCTNCHSSFAVNTGGGSVQLTSNMTNWQYIPGQTYTINATVKRTGNPLFGIGLEVLNSSNTNAGTITITNAAKTQKKNAGNGRVNLVHTNNGGLTSDSAVFTFNWTAPSTNIGNVTFYYSGMAANNSGDENGDHVYTGSRVITPGSATGIEEVSKENFLSAIRVINSERKIVLNMNSNTTQNAQLFLMDLTGRVVASLENYRLTSGENQVELSYPSDIKNGIYIISAIAADKKDSRRIPIIQ